MFHGGLWDRDMGSLRTGFGSLLKDYSLSENRQSFIERCGLLREMICWVPTLAHHKSKIQQVQHGKCLKMHSTTPVISKMHIKLQHFTLTPTENRKITSRGWWRCGRTGPVSCCFGNVHEFSHFGNCSPLCFTVICTYVTAILVLPFMTKLQEWDRGADVPWRPVHSHSWQHHSE